MIDLRQPIDELAKQVRSGKVTAVELVQASLDRITETESFHTVLELSEDALSHAKAVDEDIKKGKEVGVLAGVPFIAKDNFLTLGTHTTAASHILEPFRAPYQAVAIKRLEDAGAIMVAKANLDAFAHGSSTENSDFGPTKNPVDPSRVPGGSSGGSAAAVALGQATFALGTDTGGSIRLPASYCGVVGLKPTYGLVPRTGVVAMGSSVDVVGPIANSVTDASTVLSVIAGIDSSDATAIESDKSGYLAEPVDLSGVRVGVVKQFQTSSIDPDIAGQIKSLTGRMNSKGATIVEIDLPSVDLALACYYVLVPAEVSSNLARYDGIKFGHRSNQAKDLEQTYRLSREEGFGAEAKRRIMIGTYVLSSGYYDAYYKQAQKVRTSLIREFDSAFEKVDVLISPTAPQPAFKLGEKNHDPLAMYMTDILTVAANLVGSAAISLPMGRVDGLPVGVQLVAKAKQDRRLLAVSRAVENLIMEQPQ